MLSKILSKETCCDCRFCCVFSKQAMWELPSTIKAELNENDEELRCPHLDPGLGCVLGDDKPLACKLWPIRVMEYMGKRYVTVSTRCQAYSENFVNDAMKLLYDGLLEVIRQESDSLVCEYHPSYRILCDLETGEEYASSVLKFHRGEVGDAERINTAASYHGTNICQYSAGNLIALADKYDTQICFDDNTLYVYMPHRNTDAHAAYLMPVGGQVDHRRSLKLLSNHAAEMNKKPMIWGALSEDLRSVCESGYRYTLRDDRDWWDYIYFAHDLATLPGKTYHKRRTALNKFMRDFEGRFSYHPLNRDNIELVRRYQRRWLKSRFENFGEDAGLTAEDKQINYMLDNYASLGLVGGYVEIDGKVAGYTLSLPLGADSYDMTTLKTSRKYPNVTVYLINSFAKTLPSEVKYINFEEDIGSEGLRKFKNDFNPCALLKKSIIEFE